MSIEYVTLIEILAKSLHKHSFYDDAKTWDIPNFQNYEGILPEETIQSLISKFCLPENIKEEWRMVAKRFVDQIVPAFSEERIFNLNDNVIDFNATKQLLKMAGSEPPSGENWLKNLKVGDIFLSRPKAKQGQPQQPYCDQFFVAEHKESTTNLIQKVPTGQQVDIWYPTLEFRRNNIFIEVISHVDFTYSDEQIKIDNELPEDETDGSSDRTVR